MGTVDHAVFGRRRFLVGVGGAALAAPLWAQAARQAPEVTAHGPGAACRPTVRACFVRRQGDYGIAWPGAIYDGEAARRHYTAELRRAADELGLEVDLRPEPVYSAAEADAWLAEAVAAQPDGLLVILLDRQAHAWPTATKAAESGLKTVVFAPVGAAFTTNTAPLAGRTGTFIASTSDFAQAVYGLRMIRALAKLRAMRFLVLRGTERRDSELPFFGTKLRTLPASDFLTEVEGTLLSDEGKRIAADYLRYAKANRGAGRDDVDRAVQAYLAARTILKREEGDGITMDCLGALGRTKLSLPCLAWSRLLDHGIPAACEADLGAAVSHALVQLLFDRPGFQQDPVAETARHCLIGAHCTCPTRLNGLNEPAEPFHLSHHHGNRDAVPLPIWRIGQRMTVMDLEFSGQAETPPRMIVSSGTVVDNVSVPPAGGCVVSVMVELDGVSDLLAYPGFHQLFFYGDYKQELSAFCQFAGITPLVV